VDVPRFLRRGTGGGDGDAPSLKLLIVVVVVVVVINVFAEEEESAGIGKHVRAVLRAIDTPRVLARLNMS
jgi:hypothetical protein